MWQRIKCFFGFHRWRLGRLDKFPRGYVGCKCGALREFHAFSGALGKIIKKKK